MPINSKNQLSKPWKDTTDKRAHILYTWPRGMRNRIPPKTPWELLKLIDIALELLCLPIVIPLIPWYLSRSHNNLRTLAEDLEIVGQEEWRKACREEEDWRPRKLSKSRRRRLSLPLPPPPMWRPWVKEQQTYEQEQSPLSRLPEEIWSMIMSYLVTEKRFHIQESYQRFGYVECEVPGNTDCQRPFKCLQSQLDKTAREPDLMPWSRLVSSQNQRLKYKPKTFSTEPTPVCEMFAIGKTCRLA
jgi:hypothetical protein